MPGDIIPPRPGLTINEPHPWTEPVDVILRWRRFVLLGTASAWAVIVLVALLWPRTVVCEATLALPNVSYSADARPDSESGRLVKAGVSIDLYKKLESALTDSETLGVAFRPGLNEHDLKSLQQNVKRVVSPITTGARDDITRAERGDTVIGMRLAYSNRDPKRAELIVSTLGTLARDELAALVARERIEIEVLKSTTAAPNAIRRKLDLAARNESLQRLVSDLQKLSAVTPGGNDTRREVVDVNQGGYRYLPPGVQLVGARAQEADNAHEIRLAEWQYRLESLRSDFFRRLDAKLRLREQKAEAGRLQDLPTLIDSEAREFLSKHSSPEAEALRAEVGGLRDALQSHHDATTFIQRPTLRTVPRFTWLIAALVASALATFLVAVLGESWRQHHPSRPV